MSQATVSRKEALEFGVKHLEDIVSKQTARSLAGHFVEELKQAVVIARLRKKASHHSHSITLTSDDVLNQVKELIDIAKDLQGLEVTGICARAHNGVNQLSKRAFDCMGGKELKQIRAQRFFAAKQLQEAQDAFSQAMLKQVQASVA